MSLIVHVPRNDKSVVIHGFDDVDDLISHPNPAIRHLIKSQHLLMRYFGYGELISRGEFTKEQLETHMSEYEEYLETAHTLDMDSTDPVQEQIEERLTDVLTSQEFQRRFDTIYGMIQRELFRCFASGAVSHDEGHVEVIKMPLQVQSLFGAFA